MNFVLQLFDLANDLVVVVLALLCIYHLLFERIRQANWKTIQWKFMSVYVCYLLFDWWLIYLAWDRSVSVFALVLAGGQLQWLHNTRGDWVDGVPDHMRSRPAPLGPPETESAL